MGHSKEDALTELAGLARSGGIETLRLAVACGAKLDDMIMDFDVGAQRAT